MATEEEINRVFNTDAGAHLYNGITKMCLIRKDDGFPVLFSKRLAITRQIIGDLLDAGYSLEEYDEMR